MTVKITVLSENRVGVSKGLIAEHGLSVFVDAGDYHLLWDTGQGFALPHNAPRLGIELSSIKMVALSHGHYDHTGGLESVMRSNGGCEVVCHHACLEEKIVKRELLGKEIVVPIGMPKNQSELEGLGGRFIFVDDHMEICPGIHYFSNISMNNDFEHIGPGFMVRSPGSERDDEFKDDAALGVVTDKGLSVILGCAHRGMVNTVRHIMERLGVDRVHSVWGGTHMVDRTPEEVEATIAAIEELGVETVGAAHCTGFDNEIALAKAMPDRFTMAHVGRQAEL